MTDNEQSGRVDQTWATVKSAWRDQPVDRSPAEPSAMTHKADGFTRAIRRRNAIEYAAFGLVGLFFAAEALGVFGRAAVPMADLVIRTGALLVVIGAAAAAWQLHRRASAPPPGTDPGQALDVAADVVSFHRRALARQRDALNSVGRWYLGPFLPGFALMAFGGFLDPGRDPLVLALAIGFVAIVFSTILVLNRRAAAAVQREIDALDRAA
ncbi:hypothetical protein [Fodinicurvata sp. EGI_FJ10296]|uniref:hypothetical protein n=1 Tax=Fodinicurvata sp. EGI_FJ10296 TaxID=3231908 RepID=UPI00345161C5